MYETIRCDIAAPIMTITLNRPERLNAFNYTMLNELLAALDEADANDDVRAVIVTGEGKAFCAGADLEKGGRTFARETPMDEHRDGGGLLSLRIFALKKPIIAAINGPAVGVGVTMTLPMDIRIASTNARFGFVFTRRGIVPEACSGWFLPRIVGISQALEWIYTGRIFPAEEALAARLVSRVVKPEELLPTAQALAREIAEHTSAVSVTLSRQLLWRMLGADHPMESHRIESKLIHWTGRQADAHEGVTAFLEKRAPRFTMKVSRHLPEFYPWWEEKPFHP
ncbi:MAG: crotonase/enoyl-CoA hydratase family protein [Bacillota bacterium]|nr:enoyl-CoA hydratase [Bacillota bacterium]